MATWSTAQLLDWLAQQQFLAPHQVEAMRPLIISFPDAMAMAKELLRRDWLTPYQVNQILQGKHDHLLFGDYRLRERLGEGAMGQVFKAWSLRHGCVVAVKTLHKERVPSALTLERFRREVEAASKLDHPNVAFVRDAGEADGKPYLVMEYVDGFNLSARVKEQGPIPVPDAVEYIRQAAMGLQHAYERGIIHRDIKPSNLMVTKLRMDTKELPIVKILDFGLARYEAEEERRTRLTKIGSLLGTVDYIAPEQAHDARSVDVRADIYSLGCSFFFILTGEPPFHGETALERIGQRLTGDAPWVRSLRPEVSPALEQVLRKMMARRLEDRYQTPREVAQALTPFAGHDEASVVLPLSAIEATALMAKPAPASNAPASDVPLAMPVELTPAQTPIMATAIVPASAPAAATLASFGGTTATAPRTRRGGAKLSPVVKAGIAAGGALALLLSLGCVVACVYGFFLRPSTDKTPINKDAAITITDAKFSKPDGLVRPGDRVKVLVWFKRTGFKGPVKISLRDVPKEVQLSGDGVAQPNDDTGEVAFTVSHLTRPLAQDIRVVLENERVGVSAERTLELKIVEPKK